MKNNPEHTVKSTSSIVVGMVAFLLLLLIILLPPNLQASDWTRSILFRLIITPIVSFLLFKFFSKKSISIELPIWNKSLYSPLILLGAFFATLLAATIFYQNNLFSIFGLPTRSGGVLNLLFL